jgi:hypothetical protein
MSSWCIACGVNGYIHDNALVEPILEWQHTTSNICINMIYGQASLLPNGRCPNRQIDNREYTEQRIIMILSSLESWYFSFYSNSSNRNSLVRITLQCPCQIAVV